MGELESYHMMMFLILKPSQLAGLFLGWDSQEHDVDKYETIETVIQ